MNNDLETMDIQAIKKDSSSFEYLPEERKTEGVSLAAIEVCPSNIRFVPEKKLTYEMVGLALSLDVNQINNIPQSVQASELPFLFKDNEDLFHKLPKESLTSELCMIAVKADGYNLEFIPEGLKTKDLCREALRASPDLGGGDAEILAHVPYPDVCLEGMKGYAAYVDCLDLIRMLRKEVITPEIADFAVAQNGHCLAAIPLHLQTEILSCHATLTSGNSALLSTTIREDIKTETAYRNGLDKDLFQSFLYIPNDKRSPGLCLTALKLFPEQVKLHPNVIPDYVRNGCNVFSLNLQMEQCTGEKFSNTQMENFYNGKPLKVKYFQILNKQLSNIVVKFDKNKEEFSFASLSQKQKKTRRI